MDHRAGYYKSNLSGAVAFGSFVPSPLPPDPPLELSAEMVSLLVKANCHLAKLDTLITYLPDMNRYASLFARKEALLSCQIESVQAVLEDVLGPAPDVSLNRNVLEVENYIKAAEYAISRLNDLPLSGRLIEEVHGVLMEGVRGQERNPGEFRTSQNWIGGGGSTSKNARYIPPAPMDMTAAISDLEKYMKTEDETDPLIQAALIHYQFETIHPFLDGNGRIGRLLITLFLMEKKVLSSPALYISYFLKKNRIEYYDRMSEVRSKGNYEQWVRFFLQAVIESAADAIQAINKLIVLHDTNVEKIQKMGRASRTIMRIFEYLEENPIIEIRKTADSLDLTYNTVSNAVLRLADAGILTQTSNASRNRTFSYEAYLDILREGT